MFQTVGDYLKYSLKRKYLRRGDLYTTDEEVTGKINQHLAGDKELLKLWERMNGKVKMINDSLHYDRVVFCKSRIVDPLFWDGGDIKRYSQANPRWRIILHQESIPKKYFLRYNR